MSGDLQTARDAAWTALGACPIRRALLGRQRCDVLVNIAAEEIVAAAGRGLSAHDERAAALTIARRVDSRYEERSGFVLSSFLISWAISAIVQALIAKWWANRHPTEPRP